jgi:predicted peptidase
MPYSELHLIESAPLQYLLSLPRPAWSAAGAWPLLCFLHGYDEGTPAPIEHALTRHGPLAAVSAPLAREQCVIVAPQLPTRGDVWAWYAPAVQQIMEQVQAGHHGDPRRRYLTGFSFGGNGVFELALAQREWWAALWPVDPTRVPPADPGRPVWLSSGEVSRHSARAFMARLQLQPPGEAEPGERVYVDEGQDHVGTAKLAYQDERIYRWLLSQRLASPGTEP